MEKIDRAISLSDVEGLTEGVKGLRVSLNADFDSKYESEELINVLKDGIRRDYGKLLESEQVDTVELIRWACRKKLIMQALTIVEARVPKLLADKKILTWKDDKEKSDLEVFFKEKSGAPSARNDQTEHYLLRGYVGELRRDVYPKKKNSVTKKWEKQPLGDVFIQELKRTQSDGYRILVTSILEEASPGRNLLKTVLNQYESLCDVRNTVCHPTEKETEEGLGRKGYDAIINEIKTFANNLGKLIAAAEEK